MKKLTFLIAAFLFISGFLFSQVAINNNGSDPEDSAGLDVNFSNKGFLAPRIALTATNSANPVAAPATGLLIYNTASAGIEPYNVTAGYYYWNGTSWISLTIPHGANTGDMLYWSGTQWMFVSAGSNGQVLTSDNGVPTWQSPAVDSTFTWADSRMALPDTIYVAVGRELNIWYDELAFVLPRQKIYSFYVQCASGFAKERSYRYTPSTTSSRSISISSLNGDSYAIDTATSVIKSVDKTAGSGTKRILLVGNSLMTTTLVTEVRDLIVADGGFTPTLLGTQGTAPNFHEGHSAWTWTSFTTAFGGLNPFFYNGRIDFQHYMSANGFTGNIDICYIQLGINDMFTSELTQSQIDEVINKAKSFCDTLSGASYGYPDCKIIIGYEPLSALSLDAYAASYETSRNWIAYYRNMRLYYETLIAAFDNGAYHTNVWFCPTGLWVDREYGYPTITENISARQATPITIQSNFVHPATSGYKQMADAIYSIIRAIVVY
jgi:lysophospholipase L1-like esterase